MYRNFFGLTTLPFNNTPDPRFFYNTPDHEEALASLLYAAQQRKGFVLVTGEVGAGKTLLSRLLLSRLDSGVRTAVITNTRLSGSELLVAICREFGLDVDEEASATEASRTLEEFLLEQYARDRLAVVILDEAQNLPIESFEELRMLGNLEADDAKLLQVLILGQPELQESFRKVSMRQLYQRIFRVFHLSTLSREQTTGYIHHRMKIAGLSESESIFDDDAIDTIFHHAEGIPRLINQICDNAMLTAYTQSTRRITAATINDVINQMMLMTVDGGKGQHPHGEFATQALGEGVPASNTPDNKPTLSPEVQAELDTIRKVRDEATALLNKVATTAREKFPKENGPVSTAGQKGDGKANEARELQQQAASMFDEMQSKSRDTEKRVRDVLSDAGESAGDIELRAAKMLRETQQYNAEMQSQVRELLDTARHQQEASEQTVVKLVSDAEEALRETRRELSEANASVKDRALKTDRRTIRMIESVREQVQTLQSQFGDLQGKIESRTTQINSSMDVLSKDMHGRIESSYTQLKQIVAAVQKDFQKSQGSLKQTREQIIAEADGKHSEATDLLNQTQGLLSTMREQSASLLATFRSQMAEHTNETEQLWKSAAAEGAKTLNSLQVDLTRSKLLAKRSRSDLDSLLENARNELGAAKATFSETCDAHKADLDKFIQQSHVIKEEVAAQFENSKQDLDQFIEGQQHNLKERIDGMRGDTAKALDTLDEQANKVLESLQDRLSNTSGNAERIHIELQKAVTELQQTAIDCHVRYENETSLMKREMKEILERDRSLLDDTHTRLNQMTKHAERATEELANRVEQISANADGDVTERLQDMQHHAEDAIAQARQIAEDLDVKLVVAKETNDRLRAEYDTLIQGADDNFNGLRGAFDNDLVAYREQASTFTEDAKAIRREMALQFEQARNDLDQAIRSHRSDWMNRVAQIVSETDGLITSSETKANETVKALRKKIDAASAEATEQFQHTVEDHRNSWNDLVSQIESRVDSAVSSGENKANETIESIQEQLDASTSEAEERFTVLRGSISKTLDACAERVAELSQEACNMTGTIATQFADARQSLDKAAEEHHQTIQSHMDQLDATSQEFIESTARKSNETIAALKAQLQTASTTAGRIHSELSDSIDVLHNSAIQCRRQNTDETERMKHELSELVTHNRNVLGDAQQQVEAVVHQATHTIEDLTGKIDSLKDSAEAGVTDAGHALARYLEDAMTKTEKLRSESEAMNEGITRRQARLREQADEAITDTDKVIATLNEKSASSLAEVRTGLIQMTEKCGLLQRDLSEMGEQVHKTAGKSMEQLQSTANGVIDHIKSLRDSFQRDADMSFTRLGDMTKQVEQGAEQIRTSSHKLMEEAQKGSEALRQHADELLSQAQNGSEKLGQQASELLMQAHASSDRFRDQAETLLRQAEATAETISKDADQLREGVMKETNQIKEKIANVKGELDCAREESSEATQEARAIQEEAYRQAEAILSRVEAVQEQTESLLRMPRELIDEATHRTTALAEMSRQVSAIVAQLSSVNDNAENNKSNLDSANAAAGDMLGQLKQHTARVGQLVGIIRQIYGSMDARLEKLRDRLLQADDLCRSVPQEITNLREALAGEVNELGATPLSRDNRLPSRIRPKGIPAASTSTPQKPTHHIPVRASKAKERSLGKVVQQNLKLHNWLNDILGEENNEQPPKGTTRDVVGNNAEQENLIS